MQHKAMNVTVALGLYMKDVRFVTMQKMLHRYFFLHM